MRIFADGGYAGEKMALVAWRTGTWKLEIVKRSDAAGFEVLPKRWIVERTFADEHAYVAPDLFTADTPLGTYQGLTDQVAMSRTPGSFRTLLVPRGSSEPEWLAQ